MGAIVVRQPVGVVACITPYNFPIVNMAGKVGPALAMGNTVVVKPAPQDPLAVTVFGEILDDAGFPPGVVNVVTGSGADVGEALVGVAARRHGVASPARPSVGQRIGEVCGRGHEAPAAGARRQGRRRSCSTTPTSRPPSAPSPRCGPSTPARSAPRRPGCIAQRGVYDQVVAGLRQAAGRLKVGDPLEPDTVVGPVISEVQRGRIEALVAAGRRARAPSWSPAATGPTSTGASTSTPTLLAGCKPDNAGRAGGVLRPGRRRRARSTTRTRPSPSPTAPSSASTTTCSPADTARGMRVARQLRTGNVGINTAQRNHEAPFGGFKQSRRRPRRRQLRPPRLQRAAEHRLARLRRPSRPRGRSLSRS